MAMTNPMDDIYYEQRNFNFDLREHRHPNCITERHFYYQLELDDYGGLVSQQDAQGNTLKTPRTLRDVCVYNIVTESYKRPPIHSQYMPSNLYPLMLMEAMYQREAHAIEWLVSTWPRRVLRVYDVTPLEDYLDDDYLTVPFEDNKDMCLVDCFVIGLLKLKPESNLRCLDFTRFEKDRKLSRELCRLPILWMKPDDRAVEKVHENMSEILEVSKDKVQKFLNRISVVYSNIDGDFIHGNKIEPINILLDLKISLDDVPLGLSLQQHTPFRFSCNRLWMKNIPDVGLMPGNLGRLLDTNRITHFEFEDQVLSQDEAMFSSFIEALASLRHLVAISLPSSVDVLVNQEMSTQLNKAILKLHHLQRLNFSYCNLKGQLHLLLGGMRQRLNYLNLKDCRLSQDDLNFLVTWRPLPVLRELDLSCNDLNFVDQIAVRLLEKMSWVTCLSVSFCSLNMHAQLGVVREGKACEKLKVLCMQGYTPLPRTDILDLLHICVHIPTLQKVVLFPKAYAFPGDNDYERQLNKCHMLSLCYRYLALRNRPDIELQ